MTKPQPHVFITGAANGFGRAAARLYHQQGWHVGAYDIDETGLETLRTAAPGLSTGYLNITNRAHFKRCFQEFAEHSGGRLDALINAANTQVSGYFDELGCDEQLKVLQTNVLGTIGGIYEAVPYLKQTPNSLCLTVSSVAGIFSKPTELIAGVSAHALKGMTQSLASELSRVDTRAAIVLPGRNATTEEVAKTIYLAYFKNQLVWRVPESLKELDEMALHEPEVLRDHYIESLQS